MNVQLSFPDKVPIIHGDGRKLSKALIHLLDNAIKFSPAGSNIFLTVTEKDDCLSLSIKDAGIGIIQEHLSCIFDGFYQGDTSLTRKYPGVELGLNICEHIVRKHDGSIRVESKVNEGSTFHIDLPIKEQLYDCCLFKMTRISKKMCTGHLMSG
ncbi:MAG: ATP-binding protein [Methanolobus sp.]